MTVTTTMKEQKWNDQHFFAWDGVTPRFPAQELCFCGKPKTGTFVRKLDYKKMLEDILPLVEDDFCMDMDCHNLPNSKPFTQEEAMEMSQRLGRVYSIAHGLHCVCGGKYLVKDSNL